ncbi:hypothetical protein ACFL6I_18920 [candidate division KSB1 bacterium]
MKKQKTKRKSKRTDIEEKRPTPSPYDSEQCWQCHYIIAPGLGMDMLPEEGGHCVCKGWTEDVFGDACELFKLRYGSYKDWNIDQLTKEDWDNLNKM